MRGWFGHCTYFSKDGAACVDTSDTLVCRRQRRLYEKGVLLAVMEQSRIDASRGVRMVGTKSWNRREKGVSFLPFEK